MTEDEQTVRTLNDAEIRDRLKRHISYLQVYGAELQRRPDHRILGDAIIRGVGTLVLLVREEKWGSGG